MLAHAPLPHFGDLTITIPQGFAGLGRKQLHCCCWKRHPGWARDTELAHGELAPALLRGSHSHLYWEEDTDVTGYTHGAVLGSGGICQPLRICV